MWGLAFLAGTVSLIIAGSVDYRHVLLRILIPFGSLYLAYQYTQKQTKQTRDAAPSPAEPVGSGEYLRMQAQLKLDESAHRMDHGARIHHDNRAGSPPALPRRGTRGNRDAGDGRVAPVTWPAS